MTRIIVKELTWNEANIEHIKKHNISIEEVEFAAYNFIAHKKGKKGRYLIFGKAGNRLLTVVIERKEETIYFLVTARDTSKKERRYLYEKGKN